MIQREYLKTCITLCNM